jgi:two-component system, OmpR family, response regulator
MTTMANTESPSLRVLLVEDSRLLAEQLSELLATTPCTTPIGVVATEQEAVAASIASQPDLLILDLHLRQGTGFGVLKALAHIPSPPQVVVLTNYSLPQYREQAMALGAHYFLDKSADFGRLPDLIGQINQQLHANRDAQSGN